MEPETEAQETQEEQEAPEEQEAEEAQEEVDDVEEELPPPKPKRVRPSRAKVVFPEVKNIGRPKKPPGAPQG